MSLNLPFVLAVFMLAFLPCAQAKETGAACEEGSNLCTLDPQKLEETSRPLSLVFERIVDGDTFIASGRTIRIWGVDAPERGETGYQTAGWLLESFIKDRPLACKLVAIDKYKRDVMHCFADGTDIGSVLVGFGAARDYKRYSGGYYWQEEKEAQAKKRGLWMGELPAGEKQH